MNKRTYFVLVLFVICFSYDAFSQDSITSAKKAFLTNGVSSFGFKVGLSKKDVSNDMLFTMVEIDEIKNVSGDFSFSGSWFIADNVAWGGKVSYGFSDKRLTVSAKVLDLLIDASTYNSNIVSSSLNIGTGVKNYVPIGTSNRFFVYNETNITYSYLSSLTRDVYDGGADIKKLMKTTHELSIGLSPGFMYFLKQGFAFEFAFNPIVMYYNRSFIKQDEIKSGSGSDMSIDFKLNLFNVYFGFAYYFGL